MKKEDYFQKVKELEPLNKTTLDLGGILNKFYFSYKQAIESNGFHIDRLHSILILFLNLVEEQLKNPYPFKPFHKSIKAPFDYYTFGLDFIRPLIILKESKVLNLQYVDEIEKAISNGENVILFANHQTEPDPQVISILLEKTHPKLAEEMIFVAGHRVVSDPLCVPFSMGRNLLCIYSKKHIEHPKEEMAAKQMHNKRTMMQMKELLSEGGKCIYVAPSGGRDRVNSDGKIEVAQFDPQSIEMFSLMAKQAEKKTHFYPLALFTYHLLPPPESVDKDLGEARHTTATKVHLCFNEEIDMESSTSDALNKKEARLAKALKIWNQVADDYKKLELL